ncbi:NAD(P)H-binding protein [Actinoplanes sp. M2I2]|uniref:NAD(P)H-binding protein n=1 Tax=Actinoplanes sp. M2I2 TaxID=1734444 RepID=UPI0035ADF836
MTTPRSRTGIHTGHGYIGSVIAEKLRQAGHQVAGLARSEASVETLAAQGIEPRRGDLDGIGSLTDAARGADGVIHTAFDSSWKPHSCGQFDGRASSPRASGRRGFHPSTRRGLSPEIWLLMDQ